MSMNPVLPKEAFMEQEQQERRPYESPAVVYEADLEVRAGTELGIPNPLDLTGTQK